MPPFIYLLVLLAGATATTNSPDERDKDKSVLKKKADIHLVVSAGDSRRTKVMTIPLDSAASSGRNPPATYVYPPTTVDLYSTSDSTAPAKPDHRHHRNDRAKAASDRPKAPPSRSFRKQEASATPTSDGAKGPGSSSSSYVDYESSGATYDYFSNEVVGPGHRDKQGAFDGRANWKPIRQAPDKHGGDDKVWSFVEGPGEKSEPPLSRRVPNEDINPRQQRHNRHPEPTREETDYSEVHSVHPQQQQQANARNRPQYADATEYVPEYYEPRPIETLPPSQSESNVHQEHIRIIRLPAPQNLHRFLNYEERRPKQSDSYQEARASHYPPDTNYRVIKVPVPMNYEPRHFRQASAPNQRTYYEYGKRPFHPHDHHRDEPQLPRQRQRYNNEQLGHHPGQYEDDVPSEIYYHRDARQTYHDRERGARGYVEPTPRQQRGRRIPVTLFEPRYRHRQFVEESRPFPAHFYHQQREAYRHRDHELDASDSIARPVFAAPSSLPSPPAPGMSNVGTPFPAPNGGLRVVRLPYNVIQNIMRGNSQIDVLNLK